MANKIQFNPTVHRKIQTRLILGGREHWAELNHCKLASVSDQITIDQYNTPNDMVGLALLRLQMLEYSEIFIREENNQYLVVCHIKRNKDLNYLLVILATTGWAVSMCPNPRAGWHHPNEYTCLVLSPPNIQIEWLEEQYPDVYIDEDEAYD